jgi:hydroxymethylpyrimidine kinase / phosphomethylpyrimidine kinase / thiamine-phosphate diphosphorylase
MMRKPIVWTIAGSDSGGGAGIQADLHTFADFQVHGCTVITALTAQNSVSVQDIQYATAENFSAQLESLENDLSAKVIKIGMLGNAESIDCLNKFLVRSPKTVVYDPVMVATSGGALMSLSMINQVIEKLLPKVYLLTPNLMEVNFLLNTKINTQQDIERSAKQLLALGTQQVLIKGGHGSGDFCYDYYSDGTLSFWLTNPRLDHPHTHGSGCTLSAAITALLARGYTIQDALVIAKMYVTQGIRLASALGQGAGPVEHLGWPMCQDDLPMLTRDAPVETLIEKFPDCGDKPLGLYPIVDSFAWVKRLVSLGVTTLQLRIKNGDPAWVEEQIKHSVEWCTQYAVRLFINDYWQLAIAYHAYGVHLGQEDLSAVDIEQLRASGLRLGISTHCYAEVACAHALQPSYIAIGPIFHTASKPMVFAPQGIASLKRWCATLSDYRLVAIGGIDSDNLASVLATGVDGVAVISAITQSPDPDVTVREWLVRLRSLNLTHQ